jgi:hypothetical protein
MQKIFLDVSSTSTRTDYPCGRVFEEGTSESAFFYFEETWREWYDSMKRHAM